VGFRDREARFKFPEGEGPGKLADVLEPDESVDGKYFVSERILAKRRAAHASPHDPGVWHENKSGHVSSYPYSCALRAGASHNYLLVNGARRLTPREMLRLQGFPDAFKIVCGDSQTRKQAGNAVPVNVIKAVLKEALLAVNLAKN
jgi:DNA (cytosine-5)-methyltransferase 1